MRDIFFFDKVPEVGRVVFMATPHKGSRIGDTTLGRLGATLASPPEGLRKLALEVLRDNPKAFISEPNRVNSVTGLTVNSPSMKIIEECGLPQVPYHTVAGALENNSTLISLEHWLRDLPPDAKTDGVVELSSAVLQGAESELVFPAEHTRVHQEKPGLAEVRRILLETPRHGCKSAQGSHFDKAFAPRRQSLLVRAATSRLDGKFRNSKRRV